MSGERRLDCCMPAEQPGCVAMVTGQGARGEENDAQCSFSMAGCHYVVSIGLSLIRHPYTSGPPMGRWRRETVQQRPAIMIVNLFAVCACVCHQLYFSILIIPWVHISIFSSDETVI